MRGYALRQQRHVPLRAEVEAALQADQAATSQTGLPQVRTDTSGSQPRCDPWGANQMVTD